MFAPDKATSKMIFIDTILSIIENAVLESIGETLSSNMFWCNFRFLSESMRRAYIKRFDLLECSSFNLIFPSMEVIFTK